MQRGKFKKFLIDKIELLALLFFLGGLFLMDVNLNNIGAYGLDITVGVFGAKEVPATNMVWTGFIIAIASYFVIAIRSLYKRHNNLRLWDIVFGTIGVLGLMITLSGGLLLFWHSNALQIPFFSLPLTRITYYHIGIAINTITLLYFALTK